MKKLKQYLYSMISNIDAQFSDHVHIFVQCSHPLPNHDFGQTAKGEIFANVQNFLRGVYFCSNDSIQFQMQVHVFLLFSRLDVHLRFNEKKNSIVLCFNCKLKIALGISLGGNLKDKIPTQHSLFLRVHSAKTIITHTQRSFICSLITLRNLFVKVNFVCTNYQQSIENDKHLKWWFCAKIGVNFIAIF